MFVDGYNLYNGLKEGGHKRHYWLDLWKLAKCFEKPQQQVLHVRYFTTYSSGARPWHSQAVAYDRNQSRLRQLTYVNALKTLPNLSVHLGAFRDERRLCPRCAQLYNDLTEKMTDVNIATHLLTDAFDDAFDIGIVVSGDTDLIPPISMVKKRWPSKTMLVAFPPKRQNSDLACAAHGSFQINPTQLRNSQLNDEVHGPGGTVWRRPPEWS